MATTTLNAEINTNDEIVKTILDYEKSSFNNSITFYIDSHPSKRKTKIPVKYPLLSVCAIFNLPAVPNPVEVNLHWKGLDMSDNTSANYVRQVVEQLIAIGGGKFFYYNLPPKDELKRMNKLSTTDRGFIELTADTVADFYRLMEN